MDKLNNPYNRSPRCIRKSHISGSRSLAGLIRGFAYDLRNERRTISDRDTQIREEHGDRVVHSVRVTQDHAS